MYTVKPLSTRRFLDVFAEEQKEKQRFCFILGSGASYTSGIRMGMVLMEQWRSDLEKLEAEKGKGYIQECAEAAGYLWEEYRDIFYPVHRPLRNEDYFTLYDLRFAGSPTSGYAFLEKEMENISPNVGYYYLASILQQTSNRLVITTNFDSLTEDALFYYSGHHPLVLGDERLASYVANVDRKPVIAKIHRDLLMKPMNHQEEMQKLQEEWRAPLTSVLSQYIPIVIGYAGGDQTLMSLLDTLRLKGIFWCTIGDEPPEKAKKIIAENRGYWVKIQGFDELMFQMAERLNILPSGPSMRRAASKRHKEYEIRDQKLRERYSISQMKTPKAENANPNVDMIQAVLRGEKRSNAEEKAYHEMLNNALSLVDTDGKAAIALCNEAIAKYPEDARGYDYRSTVYHLLENYEPALADADKAIELKPDSAQYYNSRSITLFSMKRYEESLKDNSRALELSPWNAEYYDDQASTLFALKRYDEALEASDKAISLDSKDASYYDQKATILHAMKQYQDALDAITTALVLDPNNSVYFYRRSTIFMSLAQPEQALADRTRAIELSPDYAGYYIGRSTIEYKLEQYNPALADAEKAIALKPGDARYYAQKAQILSKLGRFSDALIEIEIALDMEPQNSRFLSAQAKILQLKNGRPSEEETSPEQEIEDPQESEAS